MVRRLLLLIPLAGCVDVEHGLVRTDDDAVAWRTRVTLHPGQTLPVPAERLTDLARDLGLRAWEDAEHRWVVQGHFDTVDDYNAMLVQGRAALSSLLSVDPPQPARWLPPSLAVDEHDWRVQTHVPPGEGDWTLTVSGTQVVGDADRTILGGHRRWQVPADQARDVDVIVRGKDAPGLGAFLIQAGPSLLCAMAGLGLLVWVNRRTRRRVAASAT